MINVIVLYVTMSLIMLFQDRVIVINVDKDYMKDDIKRNKRKIDGFFLEESEILTYLREYCGEEK